MRLEEAQSLLSGECKPSVSDHQQKRAFYQSEPLLLNLPIVETPLSIFRSMLDLATKEQLPLPEKICLTTVENNNGTPQPVSRIVLMRKFDGVNGNLVFQSYYTSRKGQNLQENPNACVTFQWFNLARSVTITGVVEPTSAEESNELFDNQDEQTRKLLMASDQSQQVDSWQSIKDKFELVNECVTGKQHLIKRRKNWGGFVLKPSRFEFQLQKSTYCNERIEFVKQLDHTWQSKKLLF